VIYTDFDKEFPDDCEANNDFTLKTDGF